MAHYTNGNLAYQPAVQKTYKERSKVNKVTLPLKEKLFYLFSVIFIVAIASIVISNYAQIVEYNYSIQKVEKSISQLQEENDQMQLKIAELSSPERILEIAQNKLGMTVDEQRIIVLSQNNINDQILHN